jgi:glyoxylase-like metal-dependent hydrolase (beta-lactamase superfamily II)
VKVLEGIYQLLTPFPQYQIEEARRIRIEYAEKPRVMKGLPYVLPYLIKSGDDTVLVDCGWNTDQAYQALEEGMKEHGSHPNEVTKLFVTHVHPDHFGMAGRLKRLSDCEVMMHEKDAELINSRYLAPRGLTDEMSKFMVSNGVPPMESPTMARGSMDMIDRVAPVPPDTQVKGGETFKAGEFDFEIIWTPGHSPGHICLYEPNR